jgi:UDP-N-acetylglucosamine diphosphorylase/glucosamine-1-phosphate N-acetyltransferase
MLIGVFEDHVSSLGSLALSRPAFALRCGAGSLLDRQQRVLGGERWGALVRPEVADLTRILYPQLTINDSSWFNQAGPGKLVLVNARWLAPNRVALSGSPEVGLVGEQVAYVVPPASLPDLEPANLSWWLNDWKRTLPPRAAGGALIDYPWQLVAQNGAALECDWSWWRERRTSPALPPGVTVFGPPERAVIDPTAKVEPLSFIDTTKGPVLIDAGAVVQAFSRIEGPCYIGPETQLLGARVRGGSFGPNCRIGGEVESSIVQGYSNKAHDGFLGHSYLGEWVNLGSGTHTSDLRNDYGNVILSVGGRRVDTGLLKVGSFIGDHTKTCIGTLLNTGSLVGPFVQLVTPGTLLPRYLPPFCAVNQGRLLARTDLGEMFATARTAMARRAQEWTEAHAEFFLALYERTASDRQQAVRDSEARRQRRAVI